MGLFCDLRSVPTQEEILVPETLLKKRKSQEKARSERATEFEKKKKACPIPTIPKSLPLNNTHVGDDIHFTYD